MSKQLSLIAALVSPNYDQTKLNDLGIKIGHLYTDHGLPVDMALDRLDIPREPKLLVLSGVCGWLVEHKRNSGATEAAVERQRKANRIALDAFERGGEVGLY